MVAGDELHYYTYRKERYDKRRHYTYPCAFHTPQGHLQSPFVKLLMSCHIKIGINTILWKNNIAVAFLMRHTDMRKQR